MNVNSIAEILKNIRDNYIRINEMTETVVSGSHSRVIDTIVRKREMLLSEIKVQQQALDQKHAEWKMMCENDPLVADIRNDIERLITAVLVLDTITKDTMTHAIEAMKSEVFSLTKTSRAAISYAKHAL